MKKKRTIHGWNRPWVKLFLVMRLSVILFFAFVFAAQAKSFSQSSTLSLNMTKARLIDVLDQIEELTDYYFYFNMNLDQYQVSQIKAENKDIREVLNLMLSDLGLDYKIVDRYIVIKQAGEESSDIASQQRKSVSGKVTDASGTPIPGATITVKGTHKGTITDSNGDYMISDIPGDALLVFSFVGMKTQEIVVSDVSILNVRLAEETIGIEEVVAIGYGTQKRQDLTGAISSVSASQIEKVPVTTVSQALQGRMSGVQITNNDGAPGAGVSVLIRGIGSFGNNSPLYVIDGYPVSGGLSGINPNDIASIDILKDASSAAIYGNRASNGVVIITTKRGKKGMLEVSFDALYSVQSEPDFYDVLDAKTFAEFAVEIADKESYPILPEWRDPSSLRNIDWQKEVYMPGLRQNYNFSMRGGSDKLQASLSLGLIDQTGIVKKSDYRRFNGAVTLDFTPKKWFKSATDIKYAYSDGTTLFGSGQGGVGWLTKQIPTMTGNPLTDQVKDENGSYGYYTKDASAVSDNDNIIAVLETRDKVNATHNLNASTYLELTPVEGLKLKSNFGISYDGYSGYDFVPKNERRYPVREATYSQSSDNSFEWLWENTINYSRTFGNHSFDLMGGVSAQENTYRVLSASGTGLMSDELRNVGSLKTVATTGYQQIWSLSSQFSRLTYKLMDRYIITGTIRRDGSSRFAKGNKYGTFPSVSGSWKIKDENFMANVNAISDLKVRVSYGEAGNQSIGLFQYEANYTTGSSASNNRGYVFGQNKTYVDGLVLSHLPNPDLKWETSKQTDIGIDLSTFNSKLRFTADYFRKESRDFLLNIQVPSQTGFTTATRNVGSIENKGFEFSVEYRNSERGFKYGIAANLTTLKNKILSFADGLTSVSNFSNLNFPNYGAHSWQVFSQSTIGGSVGEFYGFRTDGIIQTQAEIDALNSAAQAKNGGSTYYITSATAPGDRKFVDLSKDDRITDADREILGSPIPKFFGGLNFDATYHHFDFNVFFNFTYGNEIFNYAKRNLMSLSTISGLGVENVGRDFYENRWKENVPSSVYPRAVRSDLSGNTRPSDAYIEDGSYVRLKNVQIGYSLPQSVISRLSLTKVRLFVSAQNLLTITGYSGLDPEMGESVSSSGVGGGITAFGLDVGTYPSSRFFSIGLNVQF